MTKPSVLSRLSLAIMAVLTLLPVATFAHVKWFADVAEPIEPYSLFEPWVIACIIGGISLISLAKWNEKKGKVPEKLVQLGNRKFPLLLNISMALIGLWAIITALLGDVLVPTVHLESVFSVIGVTMLVTGVTAMIPYTRKLSALGFAALWLYLVTQLGILGAMEHVFILGIVWLMIALPLNAKTFVTTPLTGLYKLTGLSLAILALQEKLLNPGLAQSFLIEHPEFNFMSLIGMTWFSDRLFILSTGTVELLLGIMIALGISVRLNTAFLALVFVSTALALGPQEVVGHLPLFGIAVLLLVYGSGKATIESISVKRTV